MPEKEKSKGFEIFKKTDSEKEWRGLKGFWIERALVGVVSSFLAMPVLTQVLGSSNKFGSLIGIAVFLGGALLSFSTCVMLSKKYGIYGIAKKKAKKKLPPKLQRKSFELKIK